MFNGIPSLLAAKEWNTMLPPEVYFDKHSQETEQHRCSGCRDSEPGSAASLAQHCGKCPERIKLPQAGAAGASATESD